MTKEEKADEQLHAKIQPTDELEMRRSVLLKGKSGTGKTSQYRTLVHGGLGDDKRSFELAPFHCLYVSSERKWASISDLKPDVWTIKGFNFPLDASEKADIMAKDGGLIEVFHYIQNEEHPYDLLYVDSGMRWSMKHLEYLLSTTFSEAGKKDTLRAYGIYNRKMRMMLDKIADLTDPTVSKRPVHVVFTWGSDSGSVIVEGQKIGPVVDFFFDDVLYLQTKPGEGGKPVYTMDTQTRGSQFEAKISSQVKLPAEIENPNLFQIINLLDKRITL